MTNHPASSFTDPDYPSMADAIIKLQSDTNLSENRRNELCSSVRSISRWIKLPAENIPAHPDFIRRHLSRLTPAAVGVRPKRFANVKSGALAALRTLELVPGQHYLAPLSKKWQSLRDKLQRSYDWNSVSRFFHFCSAQNITPDQVSMELSSIFLHAMTNETMIKDPRTTHQNFCRAWNRLLKQVKGWPQVEFLVPKYAQHYILDWNTFPKSFQKDVDAYLHQLESDDPLDLNAPPRPLRPGTIKNYRYELRRAASALVHRGVPAHEITSLAELVKNKHVEEILRFLLERTSNPPRKSAGQLARLLAKVARHWVQSNTQEIDQINRFSTKLLMDNKGLSNKNRERLAPLRDQKNLIKLFSLPNKIRETLEKKPLIKRRDALLMQHAVALSILTYCPLRIGNISGLHLDRHLIWTQPNMRGELYIQLNADEVKNRQNISFPLPLECVNLIRLYVTRYKPLLTTSGSQFLFPGPQSDKAKRSDTLSKQLGKLIHKSVGLEVNPHLYRHLVHLIVLNRYPGAYAMVSRVLGHKSLQTAISNYAGEDISIAIRAFQDLVHDTMAGPNQQLSPDQSELVYGLTQGLTKHG